MLGSIFFSDLIFFLPEIYLIFCILVVIFIGLYLNYYYNNKLLILVISYLVIFSLVLTLGLFLNQIESCFFMFNGFFSSTLLTKFSIVFMIFLVCVILFFSVDYFQYENFFLFEYPIFLLFFVLGFVGLVLSNDFFTLYLFLEMQSFVIYVLTAIKRYSTFSSEAGLKYFIFGAFSSGLLLFGISLIYGAFGTTNFIDINSIFISSSLANFNLPICIVGLSLLTVGFFFKLGIFFFHFWMPDVYEGSPTIVTVLIATVAKFSVLIAFLKVYFISFYSITFYWHDVFIIFGSASVVFGSLGAFYQQKIKRLIAYSSIVHMGYTFLGLGTFSLNGLIASIFYLIIYSIISLGFFFILIVLRRGPNKIKFKNLEDFELLWESNPFYAVFFALILFSLAGIPPLAGFFGKLLIFFSLIQSYNYFPAILVLITSVFSSVYYLWLIKLMFFRFKKFRIFISSISHSYLFMLALIFFFNVSFIFFQNDLIIWLFNIIA